MTICETTLNLPALFSSGCFLFPAIVGVVGSVALSSACAVPVRLSRSCESGLSLDRLRFSIYGLCTALLGTPASCSTAIANRNARVRCQEEDFSCHMELQVILKQHLSAEISCFRLACRLSNSSQKERQVVLERRYALQLEEV